MGCSQPGNGTERTKVQFSNRSIEATDLRSVNVHLMERIDCDENVSHIGVDLISVISTLKLLCD